MKNPRMGNGFYLESELCIVMKGNGGMLLFVGCFLGGNR